MDVFLDYHGADIVEARQLARAFEAAGREVLMDEGSVVPERAWLRAVGDDGLRAPFLLLVVTPRTPEDWIRAHESLALAQHAWAHREGRPFTLIPVLLGGRRLAGFAGLERWPFAEIPAARDLADAAMSAFGRDLDHWKRAQPIDEVTFASALGGGPFPGLRAFNEARATLFMGRDEAIRHCVQRIEDGVRWLQIEGASGVGKTSLVRAGLLTALRIAERSPFGGDEGESGFGPSWRSCVVRVGTDPVYDLALALHKALDLDPDRVPPNELARRLFDNDRGLVELIEDELPRSGHRGLVLVLDQLDDGFTQQPLHPERFEPFDRLVARTVISSSAFRLVTTVRADRLDDFRALPQLEGQLNLPTTGRYHLPPMREDDLRAAIVDPIHLAGGAIEDALVERLVDLAEPELAQLPKLAVVLRALWRDAVERAGDRPALARPTLALSDLEGLEAAPVRPFERRDEPFEGLRRVFSCVMDQSLDGLNQNELEAARDMLVHVVRPGRSGEDMRCMHPRGDVVHATDHLASKQARKVLEQLAGPAENRRPTGLEPFRVIESLDTSGDSESLDLRHDVLLTEWRVLAFWLEEAREFLERRDELMLLAAKPEPFQEGPPPSAMIVRLVGEDLDATTKVRYFRALDEDSRSFVERLQQVRPDPPARATIPRWVGVVGALGLLVVVGVIFGALRYRQDLADENRMGAARIAESEGATHAERILLSGVRRPQARPQWSDGVVTALRAPAVRRSLVGPGAEVLDLAVSADGSVLVAGLADGQVAWWRRGAAEGPSVVQAHRSAVRSVAVAPDGSWFVSTSHDGTAAIHRTGGSGEPIALEGHSGPVGMATIGPRGLRVLTASDDGTVRVWRPDGELEGVLDDHRGPVRSVDISPDGMSLLTAGQDGTARVWELLPGSNRPLPDEASVLPHGGSWVQTARFSPDGASILTGTVSGDLRVWSRPAPGDDDSLEPPAFAARRLGSHGEGILSAVFDASGERIVSTGRDRAVRVWRVAGGELAALELDAVQPVRALFTPDGRDVLVAVEGGNVRRWDPAQPKASVIYGSGRTEVRDLVVRSAPPELVTGTADGVARVWDLEQALVPEAIRPDASVRAAWFGGPTGARLFAAVEDGGVRVLDRAVGQPLEVRLEGRLDGAAVAPGGEQVATLVDGRVRVWTIDGEGRPVGDGDGRVERVAFSPDAAVLGALGEDGVLRLYRPDSGDEIRSIRLRRESIVSFAFDPDGTRIVTGGASGNVSVWSILGDFPLKTFEGATGEILAVAMADGDRVVAGTSDRKAHVWSVSDPELVVEFDEHGGAVRQVLVTPKGDLVLTLGDDRVARLWEVERPGAPRATSGDGCSAIGADLLPGPRVAVACRNGPAELWSPNGSPMRLSPDGSAVVHVAFSPDGTELLTASDDGPVAIWPASVGRLRDALLADVEPCLTPGEREHFLGEDLATAWTTWRGCERACWGREFGRDVDVASFSCLRERVRRSARSGG